MNLSPEKASSTRRAREIPRSHMAVIVSFAMFALAASVISVLGYLLEWEWTGVIDKTFWHWLGLLFAPVLLSGGGFLLYTAWAGSEQRIKEKEAYEASRHADLDKIAQGYLDSIQELMLDREAPEEDKKAQHNVKLSAIARARTLNVFEALDPIRKGTTIRFLVTAGLLMEPKLLVESERENPVKSDTSGGVSSEATHGPPIPSPFFIRLKGANLQGAYLRRASLQGGSSFARAHLEEANLQEANLQGNNLQGAHLQDTNLTNADLSRADLSEATGWTAEQLDQAKSLRGATMPNGQKYEDWLKDRGEEVENRGTS